MPILYTASAAAGIGCALNDQRGRASSTDALLTYQMPDYTLPRILTNAVRGEGFFACPAGVACLWHSGYDNGRRTHGRFQRRNHRLPLQAARKELADNRVGEWECMARPWMFQGLRRMCLRCACARLATNQEEAAPQDGGAERVRMAGPGIHAAQKMLEKIEALKTMPLRIQPRAETRSEDAQIIYAGK